MDPGLRALELKLTNELLSMKQKSSKNEFIEKFTSNFEAIKQIVESNKAEILSKKFSPQLFDNGPQQVPNNLQNAKTDQFQLSKPEPLIIPQRPYENNNERNKETFKAVGKIGQAKAGGIKNEMNRPDEMNSKSELYVNTSSPLKSLVSSSNIIESQIKFISNFKGNYEEEKLIKPVSVSKSTTYKSPSSNTPIEPIPNPKPSSKLIFPAPALPSNPKALSKTITQSQPSPKLTNSKPAILVTQQITLPAPAPSPSQTFSQPLNEPNPAKSAPKPNVILAGPAKAFNPSPSPFGYAQADPKSKIEPSPPSDPQRPVFSFNPDTPSFEMNQSPQLSDWQMKAPELSGIPGIPVLFYPPCAPSYPPKISVTSVPSALSNPFGHLRAPIPPAIPQAASNEKLNIKSSFSSSHQSQPKTFIPSQNLFQPHPGPPSPPGPPRPPSNSGKYPGLPAWGMVPPSKVFKKEKNTYSGKANHKPPGYTFEHRQESSVTAPVFPGKSNKIKYPDEDPWSDPYSGQDSDFGLAGPEGYSNYMNSGGMNFNQYKSNRDAEPYYEKLSVPKYENYKDLEPYSQFSLGSKSSAYRRTYDLNEDYFNPESQSYKPCYNFPGSKHPITGAVAGGKYRDFGSRFELGSGYLNHYPDRLNFCSSSDDELTYERLVELEYDLYDKGNGFDEETVAKLRLEDYREDFEDKLCVVCQNVFCIRESVARIKCGHLFHKTCIQEWLLRKKRCPMSCKLKRKDFN